MASRDGILAKIRALQAKTAASGCSEAEALAAAEKAAELLRLHNLDAADIEIVEASTTDPKKRPTWLATISATIAYVTNTGSIQITARDGCLSLFIGRTPGPEIAVYLRDICVRAVHSGLKDFRGSRFYKSRRSEKTRRAASLDFCDGMAERLCSRLVEMFAPSRDEAARAEARQAMERRFQAAKTVQIKHREARFAEADRAGWKAGGDVALNRGVRDSCKPLLIGRG